MGHDRDIATLTHLERMFDSAMMDLVGRWWNSRWGRLARMDIWLYRDGTQFLVRARKGDSEGPVQTWTYACEPDARVMVQQLIDTGGEGWKEITELYRRPT